MSMTFSQWLSHSADAEFESFVRTRRDLLQPESPTIPALAAAASSRISVSRGIEALDAEALEVFIDLAKAARTTPEISVLDNAHVDPARAEAALPRLRDLGLAWPASTGKTARHGAGVGAEEGAGAGEGAGAEVAAGAAVKAGELTSILEANPVWKVQSEAITLLPTSAAESARPLPWQIDPKTIDASTAKIGQPVIHNSEQAAVAEVISSLRGLVDELSASPISRLTSGGISKRDVSKLARSLDLTLEQTITLLLAAKSLHLIGVLDDALDPQWTAADDADSVLAGDRAELWAALVTAWLRESLDVTQLAAGASENERLTVLASPKKSLFKGYAQSVPTMPLLRLAIITVLHDIGLGSARSARWIHAEVLRRHPLIPAHGFAMTEAVLHTCVSLGLATTPLQQPDHFGPSRFGLRLAAGLQRAMVEQAKHDPSILPLGVAVDALEVPGDVIAAVTEGLGAEVDTVLIQSDLTAVATGPIEPRVHHILRRYAVVEARGQGTVYRIDAETIEDTMQSGLTPEEALAELAGISAEELPTTLDFLVKNTASKLRRVRVAGARAVLVVDDPVDLDVIFSDQLMMPAGLERLAPTVAISQLGPERTMHLLEAGDHHALLHSAAGPVRRRKVLTQSEPEVSVRRRPRVTDGHLDEYIRILRSAPVGVQETESTDEPLGHMDRLREAAETKTRVLIRIADSQGRERSIEMQPSTLNAGRVRGVVTTTGAEASLSIARIVSVTPSP